MAGIAGCSGGTEDVEGGDHSSPAPTATSASTNDPTTTPTESATPTETATSTPSVAPAVSIADSAFERKEGDYQTEAFALVTFTNEGSGTAGEVRTTVRFYDDDDNLVDDTIATLPYLKSGETWKAKVPYLGDGSEVVSHKVDGEFERKPPRLNPDGVSTTDTKLSMDDFGVKVTGVMVNELDEMADYVAAHARFWNGDTIIGGGLDNQTEVPAGENWKFESSWTGYGDWYENASDFDVALEVTIYGGTFRPAVAYSEVTLRRPRPPTTPHPPD